MTSNILMILPHQLYPRSKQALQQVSHIYCIEEPFLFKGFTKDLKVHKLKCAYMRASMRWYFNDYLAAHARQVPRSYVDYDQVPRVLREIKASGKQVHMDDPVDIHIREKYAALFGESYCCLDHSPLFLATRQQLDAFYTKHAQGKKQISHAAFYEAMKHHLHVLETVPSTDEQNREPLPASHQGRNPTVYNKAAAVKQYYEEAERYVERHFKDHVGNVQRLPLLPITHRDAKKHLTLFIRHKLRDYGSYQDAIHTEDPFTFHAFISFLLNNGLLSPREVLKRVMAARVPMNSKEGFVRQLIGWREYMRFIYGRFGLELHKELRISKAAPKLKASWYDGSTGITPYDHEVQKVHQFAFAHHIVRLMVFLNLMKLYNCSPGSIYKWFMELVALDAYDWVMVSNLAAMGHWGHPKFMRRPYLSSSNYIKKQSNYGPGSWQAKWDDLYHTYVKRHAKDEGMGFYKRT